MDMRGLAKAPHSFSEILLNSSPSKIDCNACTRNKTKESLRVGRNEKSPSLPEARNTLRHSKETPRSPRLAPPEKTRGERDEKRLKCSNRKHLVLANTVC